MSCYLREPEEIMIALMEMLIFMSAEAEEKSTL